MCAHDDAERYGDHRGSSLLPSEREKKEFRLTGSASVYHGRR